VPAAAAVAAAVVTPTTPRRRRHLAARAGCVPGVVWRLSSCGGVQAARPSGTVGRTTSVQPGRQGTSRSVVLVVLLLLLLQ
jgi:hypothetical protein